MNTPTGSERDRLRLIAEYQWGRGAGDCLFTGPLAVTRSRSKRIRQVYRVDEEGGGDPDRFAAPSDRIVTFGRDGRFTLGLTGGQRLVEGLDPPRARVVVGDESRPHVRNGKNAFAKFVRTADPTIRPLDEVAVVHSNGELLAVGRAELDAAAMDAFERGVAVDVRSGVATIEAEP